MTASEFVKQRKPDWVALEQMLSASARARRLRATPAEISRFAALFRSACSDLARARALGFPDEICDYLNSLTARSHNLFYVAPPFDIRRLFHFFTTLFPLTVRRNAVYMAAGLLLFYAPMTAMIGLSLVDDQVMYQLVPKKMLEQFEKMYEKGHREGREATTDLAMTGYYVKNNIGIAFQCFAAGIFVGIGSIFTLIFNGVVIGAVVGFVAQTPSSMNLLSFIVGHGPFELTAIGIAGAAGLRLGFGAIITRNRRRSESLRLAARDAIRLVLGSATLLAGAALIEGFFSPSSLPMAVKFGFGGFCALFLVWYLGFYARKRIRSLRALPLPEAEA